MKPQYSFALAFFVIGLFFVYTLGVYSYFHETKSLLDRESGNLARIAESRAEIVGEYLDIMEQDILLLQDSGDVKWLLAQDLVIDQSVVEAAVNQRAVVITKEVENYVREHKEMALKDLKDSAEFRTIAIQQVGNRGYSAIYDNAGQVVQMHRYSEFDGLDSRQVEAELPEIYRLSRASENSPDVSGFYDWKDPDGKIRRKFARFLHVTSRTADGIGLVVITTAYVDDFKIILPGDSSHLADFANNARLQKAILITPDGYVAYMAQQSSLLGNNLNWESNINLGISKNYLMVNDSNNISFYGPFIGQYGDIYPKISIMGPVYMNGTLIGYVGLSSEMDKIFKITEESDSTYETEESYLVNSEKLLISPVRQRNLNMLVQSVETENVDECFEDIRTALKNGLTAPQIMAAEKIEKTSAIEFLNYRGDLTLGTDFPIKKTNWCLLSEISMGEVLFPLEGYVQRQLFSYGLIVLLLTAIGFFIGSCINNEKCPIKALKKIQDFLAGLKIRYHLLIALIISVIYFLLIVSLFKLHGYLAILKNTPSIIANSLLFIIAFAMAFYAPKLRNVRSKAFFFLGSLFIILHYFVRTPLEIFLINVYYFNVDFFVPALFMLFTGFILLMYFLARNTR
jgi:hypothetical protein